MTNTRPAPLAPTLLFTKGRARSVAYETDYGQTSRVSPADPVPPPIRRIGTRRGSNPPGEVKLSFHVDAERHRRLKLAMAHLRRTGQEFVIAAIDHYLDHVVPTLLGDSCACLDTANLAGAPLLDGIGSGPCHCGLGANSQRSSGP